MDFRFLAERLNGMSAFSRIAFRTGAVVMLVFYIIAVICRAMAPDSGNYFELLAICRGCLETAPACLAVGVCTALIGDLVLNKTNG